MEENEIGREDEIFQNDEAVRLFRQEEARHEEFLHGCIQKLIDKLSLSETENFPDVSNFEIIPDSYSSHDVKYFQSNSFPLTLHIAALYHDMAQTMYYDDASVIGIIEMKNEYPRTILYKETFKDKLVDLLAKGDIDFKDQKKFSSVFHLVSADRRKIESLWYNKQLDPLAEYPTLEMEINGKLCVYILHKQNFGEEQTIAFAGVTKSLLNILS